MEVLRVNASQSYDVMIGSGLLADAGRLIAGVVKGRSAVIVSDDNVFPLYGAALKLSLTEAGFNVFEFIFKNGEQSKTLKTYSELLEYVFSRGLTRSDCLIALGGVVTGDLTGFAAATYQRGISFVQLPTTLLAAVDSSVGGKTAVDLEKGKNQVGCFYQPALVLCDTDTLKTLPDAEYRNGCAEIIKYAFLGNRELYENLISIPVKENYEHVIGVCVAMKREFVEQDERDRGERMKLNLGHTIAHAIEALSGYETPHGLAVAMGLNAITRAANKKGFCADETAQAMQSILELYELPARLPYDAQALADAAATDKKASGSFISIIVPRKIGKCEIMRIPKSEFTGWVEAGA